MEVNQKLISKLKSLSNDELSKFGFTNCQRVVDIYKAFDRKIKEENYALLTDDMRDGYDHLTEILLNNTPEKEVSDESILERNLNLSRKLSPNDDDYPMLEAYVSQYVANCISYYLNFRLNKNIQNIVWNSDSVIEVVNFIESERQERENEESEANINKNIADEVNTQLKLVDLITAESNQEIIIDFAQNNKINWL